MAKDPAILFYTGDFLVGTMRMSYEQTGKYIKLLCMQHQSGGFLTQEDIDFVLSDKDKNVLSKFLNTKDGFYNERLKEEIDKRKAYSESRRKNRNSKKKDKKDMSNICQTYVEHMENENEDININTKEVINVIKKKDLITKKKKEVKHHCGEYNHVMLTTKEVEKLKIDFPDYLDRIKRLDEYIESTGKVYKNHNLTIHNWATKDKKKSANSNSFDERVRIAEEKMGK
jgi:uncharacterized protein YdaU (DUF1376 family)